MFKYVYDLSIGIVSNVLFTLIFIRGDNMLSDYWIIQIIIFLTFAGIAHYVQIRLEKRKIELEKLNSENQLLKSENEKLKSENEKLKSENEKLKSENEKLKSDNEKLKFDNEKLKSENEAQKIENEKLKSDIEKNIDNNQTPNYPIIIPQTEFSSKDPEIYNKTFLSELSILKQPLKENPAIEYKQIIPREKMNITHAMDKDFRKFSMFQGFYCKECNKNLNYTQINDNEFQYTCGLCKLTHTTNIHPQDLINQIHIELSKLREICK